MIKKNVGVVPRTGSVPVFPHYMIHEGSLVEDGVKYTLKTDVFFMITQRILYDSTIEN